MISTLARPLLAAPFIASGIDALTKPESHREAANRALDVVESLGIQRPSQSSVDFITRATGAVFTVAGLTLARGKLPRSSALLLGALQLPISLARNPFWEHSGKERRESISSLISAAGLVGGALIATQDRGGKPSLAWRAQRLAKDARDAASDQLDSAAGRLNIGDGR
ncbi:putative membrane protein YphA (DoxX/SURF4 family) [Trueperella bonasi]|uniref:Membrane protein YphA (DoxX/SURF4 family) n=1 Tax=Trueperella bonasi TaxID=312286 RepID=A0ABT9NH99_9ACTO|nr:DoxX family membrane protein [Trueperella bonasi]MDP9806714.1 putative membrane protein YphA (DoxX/SURF4 family) [Trueperella bonasi]